ncbi:MAG: hypothetical protein WBB49_01385 [Microgenomates group bacterium]|nr:MAG: hypothetical protein IPH70_04445 [Candidatus Roizmanbacteria bacterium]
MIGVLLAQCVTIGENGPQICGPAKQFNGTAIQTPADVVNQVMPFAYGLSLVILLFVFIWGGFDLILSRGAPEKIKTAKAKITSGIIGVILLAVAYLIVQVASRIFGLGTEIF